MSILAVCPHCGRRSEVSNEFRGRQLTCPDCRHGFIAGDTAADTDDVASGGDISSSIGARSDIASAGATERQRQITHGCIVIAGSVVYQSLIPRGGIAASIADI